MTYTVLMANGQSASNYFDVSYGKILISKFEQAQSFEIIVTGTAANGLSISQPFQIHIDPRNDPPYFKSDLKSVVMKSGDTFTQQMPQIIDPEGDLFSMSFDFGDAKYFVIQLGNQLLFKPTVNESGDFTIKITLKDKSEYRNKQTYDLSLTVIPLTDAEKALLPS